MTNNQSALTDLKWHGHIEVASFHILRLAVKLGILLLILPIRHGSSLLLRNWFSRFFLLYRKLVSIRGKIDAIFDPESLAFVGEGGVVDLAAFFMEWFTLGGGATSL